jgi:hypothetical protein
MQTAGESSGPERGDGVRLLPERSPAADMGPAAQAAAEVILDHGIARVRRSAIQMLSKFAKIGKMTADADGFWPLRPKRERCVILTFSGIYRNRGDKTRVELFTAASVEIGTILREGADKDAP